MLGTSPFTRNGNQNPFFYGRIDQAAKLFHAGKGSFILVSGTFTPPYYDETKAMRLALIEAGVDSEYIIIDNRGFDTFASMKRAKEVFHFPELTIVSQKFHAPRALYLANSLGIDGISYYAADISGIAGLSVQVREIFARIKAIFDIMYYYVSDTFTS